MEQIVWFVRHSERLDFYNKYEWMGSPRFKENPYDPPLTKHGKKIAMNAAKAFIDNDIDKIKYIYTSPFSRCVKTAIYIAKCIHKYIDKIIKIRIEYGLREIFYYDYSDFDIDGNKFIGKYKGQLLLDDCLLKNNIIEHYNKYIIYFDLFYDSISKFNNFNFTFNIPVTEQFNRAIHTYNQILKNNDKGLIIVTHGMVLTGLHSIIYKKIMSKEERNLFSGYNYCVSTKVKKSNKLYSILYGPKVPPYVPLE